MDLQGFGVSIYLIQVIFGAVDLPAKLVSFLVINNVGRRPAQMASLLLAGICGIAGVIEWMYMLKTYPFSQVYPLSSMSFLFGMFVAIIFFKETVVWQQWVGVFLILAGCGLIAR